MERADTIADVRRRWESERRRNHRIGFVPTMGALHEGHLSLVDRCREQSDTVVASVFVNPTQFSPHEDFQAYPRDLDHDQRRLAERGVDVLFAPSTDEMYPERSLVGFQIEGLTDHLCGPRRPGHFEGVLLVVSKLFHIVRPDVAVFGQKDLQQLIVIRRMVRDLDLPIEILAGPIVREADGLALSSRNEYLSPDQREQATVLHRALRNACGRIERGERSSSSVVDAMEAQITEMPDAAIDYVEIVDLQRLQPVDRIDGQIALALAVHIGTTRLIDNLVLEVRDDAVREIDAIV